MFGKIVGAGQAGFVFENPKNPDSYFKIVALPEQPLETMPLRSTKARLGAINQNQAELFFRLFNINCSDFIWCFGQNLTKLKS